jgi:hypothetical protein
VYKKQHCTDLGLGLQRFRPCSRKFAVRPSLRSRRLVGKRRLNQGRALKRRLLRKHLSGRHLSGRHQSRRRHLLKNRQSKRRPPNNRQLGRLSWYRRKTKRCCQLLDCLRYLHATSEGLVYGLVGRRPGMARDRVQAKTVHDDNLLLRMFIFTVDEVVRETCHVNLFSRFYTSDLRGL